MKKLFKRFSYILLSCYMVFCPVASASLEVQAFEWVGIPSLTFAESLGYLLSLLGIAYVGDKATNWEGWNDSGVSSGYADEFQQYAIEHGLTYEETTSWMDEVGIGRLNQASQVWEKFKAWASSLVSGGTSIPVGASYSDVLSFLNNKFGSSVPVDNSFIDYPIYAVIVTYNSSTKYYSYRLFTTSSYEYNFSDIIRSDGQVNIDRKYKYISIYNINSTNSTSRSNLLDSSFSLSSSDINYISNNIITVFTPLNLLGLFSDTNTSASSFVSLSPDSIDAFSLALQGAISSAIPDVIPLPWDNVGDNSQAINDKMDELLEKVALGVLTIPAFMEAVQTLLGVFTVDTTADGVLIPERPNPDTPDEPQKLEDEAEKNKSNSGFMLGGLEKVFPFCIPFDLYAFMTLLVADPVAPVIKYPIYNPVTDDNEIITIDFSTWESVVVIFRYIFDFLFIIGLLLIARALIGEGSDA